MSIPSHIEPRPIHASGPTTAIAALKFIGVGIACLSLSAAFIYVGIFPLAGVMLIFFGIIGIPYGVVVLILPRRLRGTVQDNINYVVTIVVLLGIIGGVVWYLLPMFIRG
jgi:hypothetical protein